MDFLITEIPIVWWVITRGKHPRRFPLYYLLGLSSECEATESQDKIFAQLGLMTEVDPEDMSHPLIAPDYFKPLSQVFADFTLWVISRDGILDVLAFADRSRRRQQSPDSQTRLLLPSWLPDYGGFLPLPTETFGVCSPYCATRQIEARIHPSDCRTELCVEGFQVDCVASVIEASVNAQPDQVLLLGPEGQQSKNFLYLLKSLQQHLFPRFYDASIFPTSSSSCTKDYSQLWDFLVQFIYCLTCNCSIKEIRCDGILVRGAFDSLKRKFEYASSYWLHVDPDLTGLTGLQQQLVPRWAGLYGDGLVPSWFIMALQDCLTHRRFFITNKGDFGLCPEGTQEGDIMVILYGGPVPYILREKPFPTHTTMKQRLLEGKSYEFIGECYVEPYMDGSSIGKEGFATDDERFEYQKKVFRIV